MGRLTHQACTILSKDSILAQIIAHSELVNPGIIWSKNNWPDPLTAWLEICFVSLHTVLIVTSWGEKAEELKSIMSLQCHWDQPFTSRHHSRKRPLGADSHQNGGDSQESQRQVQRETTSFYWKIVVRNLWSTNTAIKQRNKEGEQKRSKVFVFCCEWRHSNRGMKTEQHLRAHKAVHLNKQGYVLLLWGQWSPSKNMVMPQWMDTRTPKLPHFHFVWKNVT